MKKIIKFFIGIALIFLPLIFILLSGGLFSLIIGGILIIVGLVFCYKNFFFWVKKEPEVPQEFLNEFELLERRIEQNGNRQEPKEPSRILWERYREIATRKQAAIDSKLPEQFEGRQEFPIVPTPSDGGDISIDKQEHGSIEQPRIDDSGSNKSGPRKRISIFRRE